MERFYLVWEPEDGYAKRKHDNKREAEIEAERLAGMNPKKEFYVLRALSVSKTEAPVKTIELDERPF